MPRHAPPLIARLRRRLLASAWLFAFLVLGKFALATTCAGDGLAAAPTAGVEASASGSADVAAAADADEGPCWHGGSGGCHCACAHGVVLPTSIVVADSAALPLSPQALPAVFVSSAQKTELRPPIA
ncbi:hypothetical protein [Dokdonella sp.]|uniref:hypothetical protein n=1 Tax=Dokdonella sp. TaxID=2291710 RepID=UPI00378485D0